MLPRCCASAHSEDGAKAQQRKILFPRCCALAHSEDGAKAQQRKILFPRCCALAHSEDGAKAQQQTTNNKQQRMIYIPQLEINKAYVKSISPSFV